MESPSTNGNYITKLSALKKKSVVFPNLQLDFLNDDSSNNSGDKEQALLSNNDLYKYLE